MRRSHADGWASGGAGEWSSAVWWEAPTLAAAAVAYAVVVHGGGLVLSGGGGSHPRLVVFLIPLLVAAAVTGLAARGARVLLLRRTAPRSTAAFLATRRLAAARALPLVLTVTAAVAVCALSFAEILSSSLHTNREEKAYVANGADVQGYVDAGQTMPATFPYPLTKVLADVQQRRLDDTSNQIAVFAVDVPSLRRVLRWSWPATRGSVACMPFALTRCRRSRWAHRAVRTSC